LSTGGSRAVFAVIKEYVEANKGELIPKVGASFQFQVKSPDSAWVLDLKDKGTVTEGTLAGADCTLELAEGDFVAMTTGEADAQKLYFGGKLKISGNVMASQKLSFMKKIDKDKLVAAAKGGGGAAAVGAGAAGAPAGAAQ